jgi:hypothetical protein
MSSTTIIVPEPPGQIPTWLAVVLTAVVVAPVAAAFAWTVARPSVPVPARHRPRHNRSR